MGVLQTIFILVESASGWLRGIRWEEFVVKFKIALLLALLLLLSACRAPASQSSSAPAATGAPAMSSIPGNVPVVVSSSSTQANKETMPNALDSLPTWASVVKIRCNTYSRLNLDGFGTDDDEASISIYGWGDDGYSYTEVMVICVRFGTGNTAAYVISATDSKFPTNYNFMTGKLFSTRKDAIVIEIPYPQSNYAAADTYVFDITNVNGHPERACITKRLSTDELQKKRFSGSEADMNEVCWLLDETGDFTQGTEIVDLEEQKRQGLKLFSTSSTSTDWRAMEQTIIWETDGWAQS